MAIIHEVIHENPEIRKRVGFFFDYFYFAAETVGVNDFIPTDNPLSLVEKIIDQLENNLPKHVTQYVENYLSHPWLAPEHPNLKNVEEFQKLYSFINQCKTSYNKDWVRKADKAVFLKCLRDFQTYLENNMFENSLKGIISYFKCSHDLEYHKADFVRLTNCLISEFIINNRSRKDLKNIFYRLLNKNGKEFPLPPSMSDSDDGDKNRFLANRTFDEQFFGINTIFKQAPRTGNFLFKIVNYKVPNDFLFSYNRLTLISPKHPILDKLTLTVEASSIRDVAFLRSSDLIGYVKLDFYSAEDASIEAVNIIKRDLRFVNTRLGINCNVEPFVYLVTDDFENISAFGSNAKRDTYLFSKYDFDTLNDNIYSNLADVKQVSKESMLAVEPIYIDALSSKDSSLYWIYLEALIPLDENENKQVLDTVSSLLLLNAQYYHREKLLRPYIDGCLFNSSHKVLGMSHKHQTRYLEANGKYDIADLRKEVGNAFYLHLIDQYLTPLSALEYLSLKDHYKRILKEAYSVRNFAVHNGIQNPKVRKVLELSFTRLITRLRWVLFNGMRKNNGLPFEEIVTKLVKEASDLTVL
jgi:uncharacterized protein YeeX (DUF496 family)